jgi:hypothetical protein
LDRRDIEDHKNVEKQGPSLSAIFTYCFGQSTSYPLFYTRDLDQEHVDFLERLPISLTGDLTLNQHGGGKLPGWSMALFPHVNLKRHLGQDNDQIASLQLANLELSLVRDYASLSLENQVRIKREIAELARFRYLTFIIYRIPFTIIADVPPKSILSKPLYNSHFIKFIAEALENLTDLKLSDFCFVDTLVLPSAKYQPDFIHRVISASGPVVITCGELACSKTIDGESIDSFLKDFLGIRLYRRGDLLKILVHVPHASYAAHLGFDKNVLEYCSIVISMATSLFEVIMSLSEENQYLFFPLFNSRHLSFNEIILDVFSAIDVLFSARSKRLAELGVKIAEKGSEMGRARMAAQGTSRYF